MFTKTWNAQSYSENSQLQYRASKKFFETLTLKGTETILDIGCGTGVLTSEIARKVPQGKVIAIDSSDSMIAFATQKFESSNLEFILMRAEELNFKFKFDVIMSSFCVHWIQDKAALFQSMAANLKESGRLIIIMPFRHVEIAEIRSHLMAQERWASYFDETETKQLLVFDNNYKTYAIEAGLDNLIFQTEDVTTQFINATKLKAFLANITYEINKLPTEELKNAFMQEVVNIYLKKHPSSDLATF
jgi:trans-aconitate 2-methyltransferase